MYLGWEAVAGHWQSHYTKLIFYDYIYEAPAHSMELKLSEAMLGFWSLAANILMGQYQLEWLYWMAKVIHVWFSVQWLPYYSGQVDMEIDGQGMLEVAFIYWTSIDICLISQTKWDSLALPKHVSWLMAMCVYILHWLKSIWRGRMHIGK